MMALRSVMASGGVMSLKPVVTPTRFEYGEWFGTSSSTCTAKQYLVVCERPVMSRCSEVPATCGAGKAPGDSRKVGESSSPTVAGQKSPPRAYAKRYFEAVPLAWLAPTA